MSYRHTEVQLIMRYSEQEILISKVSNNIHIPQFQVLIAGNEHSFADHKLIKLRISIHACIANKEAWRIHLQLFPIMSVPAVVRIKSSKSYIDLTSTQLKVILLPNQY